MKKAISLLFVLAIIICLVSCDALIKQAEPIEPENQVDSIVPKSLFNTVWKFRLGGVFDELGDCYLGIDAKGDIAFGYSENEKIKFFSSFSQFLYLATLDYRYYSCAWYVPALDEEKLEFNDEFVYSDGFVVSSKETDNSILYTVKDKCLEANLFISFDYNKKLVVNSSYKCIPDKMYRRELSSLIDKLSSSPFIMFELGYTDFLFFSLEKQELEQIDFLDYFTFDELTIPKGKREIVEGDIWCCPLRVNIPDSVVTIGSYAFNALPIQSVFIPSSVTCIETCAFFDCIYLEEINYGGTVSQWKAIKKQVKR